MEDKVLDPKGLMREAYRIEGIDDSQCRSIFLDWALGVPVDEDSKARIQLVLDRYGDEFPDHPMTQVLQQGLVTMENPKRRGGWRSRER